MQIKTFQVFRSIALIVCGVLTALLLSKIADQSDAFEQGTVGKDRPLLLVIKTFWRAFGVYLFAWAFIGGFSKGSFRAFEKYHWLDFFLILGFAIWFRVIMIPTVPIQEIDIYRYVWDGAVVAEKLDPYQYGTKTIVQAMKEDQASTKPAQNTGQDRSLPDYTNIVSKRPGLIRALEIIHYGQYTSPYPPVSQLFFAIAVSLVDDDAPVQDYITAMKTMLVVFDVLTGIVLALLLYHIGLSPALSLAYLWCPLVIKEIANGGHLDSIATFFMVVAVYFAAKAMWKRKNNLTDEERANSDPDNSPVFATAFSAISAISLAAAIAAKVFPIVIAPLWLIVLFRRIGFKAVAPLALLLAGLCIFSYPMVKHLNIAKQWNLVSESEAARISQADPNGIEAFSKFWEMNDFLFMLVVENLKPDSANDKLADGTTNYQKVPWFRFTSNEFRTGTVENLQPLVVDEDTIAKHGYTKSNIAFFITRLMTLGIFALISIWCCVEVLYRPNASRWLELTFLTLAWFWLLSPTQNPWYWVWAVPFLAFAIGRAWFFMSGILFTYYLRFWFGYQFDGQDVISQLKAREGDSAMFDWLFPLSDTFRYQGNTFYDFYLPFLEFGLWMLLLFVAAVFRFMTNRRRDESKSMHTI